MQYIDPIMAQSDREEATERFSARLTSAEKALLERAAAIEGRTLTDFVLANARKAAEATIRDHDILTLSVQSGQAFAEALARGPKLIAPLRAAFKRNPGATRL